MIEHLSLRLRELRDQNNWTVADMAERTGIPKRTLDKYMLRIDPSLPGFDALCALSRGLGVSLDWLVFGSDLSGKSVGLIANRVSSHVVRMLCETLLREFHGGRTNLIVGERILRLTPEEWSVDLGGRAEDEAIRLLQAGVTLENLLSWREAQSAKAHEMFSDMVEQLIPQLGSEAQKTGK